MENGSSTRRQQPVMAGILTKTVARSPVVRWILHARIRRKRYNDVVFVGDDFIEVKQVKERGHLQHIAIKTDFDCRIRAAKTFSNITHVDEDEDFFIKVEDEAQRNDTIPPQSVVLTTDANELLFVYLADDGRGSMRFSHQVVPLPSFDKWLFQPGEHLAIDPYSRAVAVAASEREVVIYSAKPKDRIQQELRTNYKDWSPVSTQRPLQIDGIIQQMDFLFPPMDDNGSYNQDQIILLLIVKNERGTRVHWIEWFHTSDLHHVAIRGGERLEAPHSVANLLIPLRNTRFLLVHGSEITNYKDILCGAPKPDSISTVSTESSLPAWPGASPRKPVWSNWSRPLRGSAARSDTDHLYLLREDGRVFLFSITPTLWDQDHAGDFDCHAGTAFASLGSSRDPDILAVAGDMSTGQVQSIGDWFSLRRLAERNRKDTMEMELIENMPNWATVTDMVTSTLPGKSLRSRDGIFVTSGRQPYGSITELRRGLEARLNVYFEFEDLRSVSDIWALPRMDTGHLLVILSSPAGTRLLDVPADIDPDLITEVGDVMVALDSKYSTLAAAVALDKKLVQITERSICLSSGGPANFEDCARIDCSPETLNIAASICPEKSIAVVAQKTGDVDTSFALISCAVHTSDSGDMEGTRIQKMGSTQVSCEPLAVLATSMGTSVLVCAATVDGRLSFSTLGADGSVTEIGERYIPSSAGDPGMCDSIAVLKPDSTNEILSTELLVVCGLRDGRIYTVVISAGEPTKFGEGHLVEFGQTKVKITQPPDAHSLAYAMSDIDTCLLTWDGRGPSTLTIESVFISDKLRPGLAQGLVVACTHLPAAHDLSIPDFAGSLTMISGNEFLVATLEKRPTRVPRQIAVNGTPNRLIYAEQQRSLVCASMKYDVRTFPSSEKHGRPEERRQIYPVIDFISSRDDEPSFTYEMQPGERVFSLLEWSFRPSEDKVYSFVLVGSSHIKSSGAVRGRITFLQPAVNKTRTVVDVKEGRILSFDAPVYALALFDDLKIVVCSGESVQIFAFHEEERKWTAVCEQFQLASPGVHATTSAGLIYISTNNDSLLCLELVEAAAEGYSHRLRPRSMGPRAEELLSHLVLDPPGTDSEDTIPLTTTLLTTKHRQLIALTHPPTTTTSKSAVQTLSARLPRSLTRLRRCAVRPKWKPSPPPGVLVDNVLGCAPDGTLVGIALIDAELWRKLSWLQRLCEWSEEVSPHSFEKNEVEVVGNFMMVERAMAIGFSESGEVVNWTRRGGEAKGHVDGDVLARVLRGGRDVAKGRVEGMLRSAARRDDGVGEWMRRHLEGEIAGVAEVLAMLEAVLESWI